MIEQIFSKIASLAQRKPTPEEQAEAALRYIERGPGEVAFEQALADAWKSKKDRQLWDAFNSAQTFAAKTAVILQSEQERGTDTTKIEIEGFEYPPGEFDGLRRTGFSGKTLIAPDGSYHPIQYRTYTDYAP